VKGSSGSNLTAERRRKLAHNQALFREVNERIQELSFGWSGGATELQIICECSDETCTEPLAVTVDEYQQVRAWGARFLVRPGHEIPEIERVVSRSGEYTVVEKLGPAAAVVTAIHRDDATRAGARA
jgi:hypothetical protein